MSNGSEVLIYLSFLLHLEFQKRARRALFLVFKIRLDTVYSVWVMSDARLAPNFIYVWQRLCPLSYLKLDRETLQLVGSPGKTTQVHNTCQILPQATKQILSIQVYFSYQQTNFFPHNVVQIFIKSHLNCYLCILGSF